MTVAADTGTDEYANRITDTAEFKLPTVSVIRFGACRMTILHTLIVSD